MKGSASPSNQTNTGNQSHRNTFAKVLDGRKQPIRGLWVRNGRFYAQLTFEDGATGEKKTRRVPLLNPEQQPVETVPQAREALSLLRVKRSEDDLPVLTRTPKFADYVTKRYLPHIKSGQAIHGGGRVKKPATVKKEECALGGWIEHLGGVHLDKIRKSHINGYKAKRLDVGRSARTFNLDVGALRNVLSLAIEDGLIRALPTEGMRPLKCPRPQRALFTVADLEALCAAAFGKNEDGSPVTKNAQQFSDYFRLLAYSGAREQEGLKLRWCDVDFDREHLIIGAEGDTKNSSGRVVDFNPKLKAHLQDMHARRVPDSIWLFPSPQRGDKDERAMTFRESLKLVRTKAKMPSIAFHDARHHFCSYAVMSGIDFMTIAKWVGHSDGGVLIGKTYGHLADEHRKAMAARLNFGPVVVEQAANE